MGWNLRPPTASPNWMNKRGYNWSQFLARFPLKHLAAIGLVLLSLVGAIAIATAQPIQVRVNRWLEVRQVVGNVTYLTRQRSQTARVGTRLQTVGEGIMTGANSRAVLAVDTGVGFIDVAERTTMRVQTLQTAADGAQVTRLQVTAGQARLQVRRFTNRNSQLEIQTPAGLSGVRGTNFGVTVQPDGKMGIATLEGSVVTSAQEQSVAVNAGFQNLTVPGEPPSPAVPLREDTRLQLRELTALNNTIARVIGRVDPVNLLTINDESQVVDRTGVFDVTTIMSVNRQIEVVVITPLGTRQTYELAIP